MLKNIDPLLNADVLAALRAMGHGDRVVFCDTNFPADSVARQTVLGRLLRIDAADCPRVARAILSVMPLDTFVDDAAARMEVVGKPQELPQVQKEVQQEIDRAEGIASDLGNESDLRASASRRDRLVRTFAARPHLEARAEERLAHRRHPPRPEREVGHKHAEDGDPLLAPAHGFTWRPAESRPWRR